jgi:2-C-methyl-D-erythritol 2,4-cyclodiphosphate synthase
MRIGFGYDSHRFEEGKPLVIGGVVIPNSFGLKGHSDGDALIHAIIDALLGAIAHGDIGSHFPDTDDKWKGADSTKLLESVVDEVFNAGYKIGNLDATIICERPKLRPYIDQIRARLAELLKTDISNISIKGKTNEKMDDVGALLGLEVHAVTLLFKL